MGAGYSKDETIKHIGIIRESGRYPWGSGENPYQRNKDFLGRVHAMKKQGLNEKEIASAMGYNTSEFRSHKSLALNAIKQHETLMATKLKEKGLSNVAIGARLGKTEGYVRKLLNPVEKEKSDITDSIANMLKDSVEKDGYIDIGVGVERHLNISKNRLKNAIFKLEQEGYTTHYSSVTQVATGLPTSLKVLAKPGVTGKEIWANRDKIKMPNAKSEDKGRSFDERTSLPIKHIDSKTVSIRYAEDGGAKKDGVIEVRRGVPELSLGNAKYAQVRIGVDGTHYLKGMVVYADDLPPGVNIRFNTNKHKDKTKMEVLKPIEDEDRPFGAVVHNRTYIENGQKKLSALNIVNEEGDWSTWSDSLSSQFLSKQSPALAKQQLGIAYDLKKQEYDEIMSLTNPVVKKKLLSTLADDADSAAVHLKAAAMPRQGSHVILPLSSLKENEIYAPNFKNGEKVVLIRYPHGGIFEIPELTVNNRNREGKNILEGAVDAVGIHHKAAEKMSGADFDGDTVIVIPNNKRSIKTANSLPELENFDPQMTYKLPKSAPKMDSRTKGVQMGLISNLITDMTIQGAPHDEIAKAVKHSMVVIDAQKHHLNYKLSAKDNGIAALKARYQGSARSGAATLISRASSKKDVGLRKMTVDPATGRKVYTYTGESYVNSKGKTVLKTKKSTKLYEEEDAFKLSSGTTIESVYATHSNKLKALGNQARKEVLSTKDTEYSPLAKQKYAKEVSTLNSKLNVALKNSPLERHAQILADSIVKSKKDANPDMDNDGLKKVKWQALEYARNKVGAKKALVEITDTEWEAIQAGAISKTQLGKILNNTDLDRIKQLATPRQKTEVSASKKAKIQSLYNSGYTQAEIADHLGVSVKTVNGVL